MIGTQTERVQFAVLVAELVAAFNGETSDAVIAAYWTGVGDLELETVARTILAVIRDGSRKFRPTPGELRALCGVPASMTPEARASLAWDAFHRARNSWISPNFDDPIIHATARHLGGWVHIWETTGGEHGMNPVHFVRKEFEATYVRYLASGITREQGAHLAGLFEIEAARTQGRYPRPKDIATGLPPLAESTVYRLGEDATRKALPAAR